ncbi:MAG: class I SAM-dependent methyltransferase [Chloroflexi bacterium]|nr:class I SAM-dependent methyltransferase [Chloroflexota bacterium]
MLIELKPPKRADGEKISAMLGALGRIICDYQQKPDYQNLLRTTYVCLDWVQYKNNFRPPVSECIVLTPDGQSIHRREIHIDLRQIDVQGMTTQLRQCLDCWLSLLSSSAVEAQPDTPYQASDGAQQGNLAVAIAAKPAEQLMISSSDASADKLYLEPFQPARNSIIWSFNTLYWNALDKWEAVFKKGYEASLPGGVTDACNPDFVTASVKHLYQILDELRSKGQLPEQIFVLEIGVGNGAQARTWLDEFQRLTGEMGVDYYDRLHYLMSDFSACVLDVAREAITPHLGHVSFLVLDAADPLKSLSFLRYKLLFVHISNVYDNLPSSELVKYDNTYHQVEVRAYLPRDAAEAIAHKYEIPISNLAATIIRFLKIGPDYFDEVSQGVHFWSDVWHALKLEERYVQLEDLSQLKFFEGFDGRDVEALLEQGSGNLRMHLNEMVLKSFINTVPLLHPRGIFQVQDIFVTDLEQYHSSFRGPGKYDGSVVNWVNGPLLQFVGNRYGYDVRFQPFTYRKNSNITILTTSLRD